MTLPRLRQSHFQRKRFCLEPARNPDQGRKLVSPRIPIKKRIGFAQSFHGQRIPTITFPACDCRWRSQIAKYIIHHSRIRLDRPRTLEETGITPAPNRCTYPEPSKKDFIAGLEDCGGEEVWSTVDEEAARMRY